MPEQHAFLSPSASKLWLHSPACWYKPAPVLTDREQAFFDEYIEKSTAADEGTLGHEIVEAELRRELKHEKFYKDGKVKQRLFREMRKSEHYSHYLQRLVDWCVQQVLLIVDEYDGQIEGLQFEKQVHCESIHPELWGTSDVVIWGKDWLHIVDFKFGRLPIHAAGNPQLQIYAYGSIETLDLWDRMKTVRGTILQPRDYDRSDMTMRAKKLRRWGQKEVRPAAIATADGTGAMNPSIETCRYCKHRVTDKAHRDMYLDLLGGLDNVGTRPSKLDMQQIETIVENAAAIKQWVDDVCNFATARAMDGKQYKNLKLVKGRSYRRFNNEKAVRRKLRKLGYEPTEYLKPKPLQTLTEIEALVGRSTFEAEFGKYVNAGQSKPKLAPISSKAQPAANALDAAADDFAEFIK